MRKLVITSITCVVLLFCAVSAQAASGIANARAMGMAGAHTSMARGYVSPLFNPANLGLPGGGYNGVHLAGVGVSVSNNAFSLDDYNSYTGATLTEADKQKLLNKIPSEGLLLSADAEAMALAASLGNFAVSVTGHGAIEANLGRDAMELILNGNIIGDTIVLDGMYAEGLGYASLNLSYGTELYKAGNRTLATGATVRYIKGLGYEKVTEINGEAVTLGTGFSGLGEIAIQTATGGSGYALDLGAALQLDKNYTVGITFFNFLSHLSWNKDTEEHRYSFSFDTLTVTDFDDEELITSSDTTIELGNFSSNVPSFIKAGIAKTSGKFKWAVDWEQGFSRSAGTTGKPRISAGAETRLLSFFPVRGGFAVGGKQGTTFAGGFGFDAAMFYLDIGAASYNAIAGTSGKGLNLAVNTGIRF
jgi:hypothetical protein